MTPHTPVAALARPILRSLHASSEHIEASALVTRDGITVASVLSGQTDEVRFGAMCASLVALAARAAGEVARGELRQVILDGSLGPMLLTHAGGTGVLAVAATPRANLGRLMLDTRRIAAQLGDLSFAKSQT